MFPAADRMVHLLLLLPLAHSIVFAQHISLQRNRQAPIVGAIRWDAWHGDRSEVGRAVQRSLGPEKWHYRLPFFASVFGDDQVRIDGASQEVVDREIRFARTARLDYWAFLLYEDGSPMNLGLQYYVSSSHKDGLHFCLILEQDNLKTSELATKQFQRVAELMTLPQYQRVAGERPLLYLLAAEPNDNAWGSRQGRVALDQLRSVARTKGDGEPYIVVLYYRAERANALRRQLEADAISAYAYQRDDENAPYRLLARETEQFWDECSGTGSAVVPIVMTGWDRRPRVERPVFWENQQVNVGIERFYRAPTPAELSSHLGHAVTWVKDHPRAASSRAILIYAWNENDEGGWLVPTLGDGNRRVQAVRKALRNVP